MEAYRWIAKKAYEAWHSSFYERAGLNPLNISVWERITEDEQLAWCAAAAVIVKECDDEALASCFTEEWVDSSSVELVLERESRKVSDELHAKSLRETLQLHTIKKV